MHSARPRRESSAPAKPSAKKAKGAAAGRSGKTLSPAGASVKKAEEPRKTTKKRRGETVVKAFTLSKEEFPYSMDVGGYLRRTYQTLIYESDDGKEIIFEYPDGTVKRKPITIEDPK